MAKKREQKQRAAYLPQTKVTPPLVPPNVIYREHILEKIRTHEISRLVVMTAPAGFGKTTTMCQALSLFKDKGLAIVWLTLDDSDNDVARFLRCFLKALEGLIESKSQLPGEAATNSEVERYITETVASYPKPIAIFFDSFESLKNPVVLGLISKGIDILPPGSCTVIGGRRHLDISVASLRAKGELLEFDTDFFRFTESEAEAFIKVKRAISLAQDDFEQLYKSTDGWITALWLASLALERRKDKKSFIQGFSGSETSIATYLAEDVLSALPEPTKEFLVRISILDELVPEICGAVCAGSDSLTKLRELEHRNLFLVSRNEERTAFEFNPLFRDFLRNQLHTAYAKEVPDLHRRALKAYLNIGRPIPAIRHALKAGELNSAITLIDKHADELLQQGRIRLLAGLLDYIPQGKLSEYPKLRMLHAWCVTLARGPKKGLSLVEAMDRTALPDESAAYLQALKPMLIVMMDQINESHVLAKQSLEGLSGKYAFSKAMCYQTLTQTSIILGDHQNARVFADAARSEHDATTGEFGYVLAESADALLDLMQGRLRQAITRLQQASEGFSAHRGDSSKGISLTEIQHAEALYEFDRCAEARALLQANIASVKDIGPPDALISSHVIFSRLERNEGNYDNGLKLLTDLESIGHHMKLPRVVSSARLERANAYLSTNDVEDAEQQLWLAQQGVAWPDLASYWYAANDTLYPALVSLRLMVRSGKASKAVKLLREELKEAESAMRRRRALKLRILLAEALHLDSQRSMALRMLCTALSFASKEGFIRTFLEEGEVTLAMLHSLESSEQDGANFAATIIKSTLGGAGEQPQDRGKASPQVVSRSLSEPLTRKELEVLRLLADGLSNQGIADRMFLSESTVRTHLRSINLKLNASNRTKAISIARKLGLVE